MIEIILLILLFLVIVNLLFPTVTKNKSINLVSDLDIKKNSMNKN